MSDANHVIVAVPPLSATATEGAVARWRVAQGEAVVVGQVIADIETDKSVLEYESPVAGTVEAFLVEADGQALAVGTPIVRILVAPTDGEVAVPDPSVGESESVEAPRLRPWSSARRRIAQRLTQAVRDVPHFHLHRRVPVPWFPRLKGEHVDSTRLTLTDVVVRSAARALAEHDGLNVLFTEEGGLPIDGYHVAVAIDTADGVVAPVVRNADRRSLPEVSTEIRELRLRAERRALAPSAFDGATMTISNLGMYGVEEFAGIITPPQLFLLCVGAANIPLGFSSASRGGAVLPCTLVCDHRAVDGAPAARLLASFARQLEAGPY